MVLTNQLIYSVNVKTMRKIFFKLCVLLKKSEFKWKQFEPESQHIAIMYLGAGAYLVPIFKAFSLDQWIALSYLLDAYFFTYSYVIEWWFIAK